MQIARGMTAGLFLAIGMSAAHAETARLQVARAVVEKGYQANEDAVNVTLTPDGRRTLARFTTSRVGRTIHLRVDGVLLTSPTLRSPLVGGELQLTPGLSGFGGLSAQEIAGKLASGRTLEMSDDD